MGALSAQEHEVGSAEWQWTTSKAVAIALYESGEWELALRHLDSLGTQTTDWYVQYLRARAALHLGRIAHAQDIARKALAYHPQNPRILFLIGDVALDSGNYDEAQAYLSQGLALRPKDREAQLSLGRVLMARGSFEEAASHYERVLSEQGATSEILLKLAICYENTKNLKRAEFYLLENSKLHQNPQMGLVPLQRFYQRQQMQKAVDEVNKRLELLQKQGDPRRLRQLQPSKR